MNRIAKPSGTIKINKTAKTPKIHFKSCQLNFQSSFKSAFKKAGKAIKQKISALIPPKGYSAPATFQLIGATLNSTNSQIHKTADKPVKNFSHWLSFSQSQ